MQEKDARAADAKSSTAEPKDSVSSNVAFVDITDLHQLVVQPRLRSYISHLWNQRFFVLADARAKAFQNTRDTRLGRLWLIGEPLLMVLLYGTIFGLLLKTSRGIDNFIGFLIIGVTFFGVMNKQLQSAGSVVSAGASLFTSFNMPVSSVVFANSVKLLYNSIPSVSVALVLALLLQWGQPLSWTIMLVVPLFLLMHLFGCGLLLIFSRVCAFIPDFKIALGYLASGWFFGSGIFYSLERYADSPTLYAILSKNPGYFYVDAVRNVALYSTAPTAMEWALFVSTALITFLMGFIFFWRAEGRYRNAV